MARGDVAERSGEQVLHELEAADRLAELHPLARVPHGGLVGSDRVADGLPGDTRPGQPQHDGEVAESVDLLQPVLLGDLDVLQRDVGVLHDAQALLVLDLGRREAGGVGADDEALDPVVGLVARPDDDDVGEGRVADPPLRAVEDPAVAPAVPPWC